MKKITLGLVLLVLLAISLTFLFKDRVFKGFLKNYLYSNLEIDSSFESVNLGFKRLEVINPVLKKDKYTFLANRVVFGFDFFWLKDFQLKRLEIEGGRFKSQDLVSFNFNLSQKKNAHFLEVERLKVKNREAGDLSLFFDFDQKRLNFYDFWSSFFDSNLGVYGQVDIGDLDNICGKIFLKNLPLGDLVLLLAAQENFAVGGIFSGKLAFCFIEGNISDLNLNIASTGSGLINIKQDESLGFLREQLGTDTYRYLLDSLRKYKYDSGSVSLLKEEGAFVFQADFNSEELGSRDILIRFYPAQ